MVAITCENADCTVGTTGKCLLSVPDPVDCEHYRSADDAEGSEAREDNELSVASDAKDAETISGRQFHLGAELGKEDAAEIMRGRYAHLIGVLGSSDAGKTCFLTSLYLMASGGALPAPYQFSGSRSFQAFEDRARGLRQWNKGQLPNQLVDHTILSDPRQASLLHLGIREAKGERRRFDLLLTDLPGEWTDNLVLKASHAESFRFLQRADGIILAVDGKLLMSDQDRHIELQRMSYFVERLAHDVKLSTETPFVILVCKSDEIEMQIPPAANELRDYVASLGFPAVTISGAAFSRTPDTVRSGTGVFEAIEAILGHDVTRDYGPSAPPPEELNTRTFRGFRG